ncbi:MULTISPECIES: sensor histidine kinase [Methylosinus]|uniref:histidine kinase n=1 Tax=Methylosinus trichosporium (strain ATCC 35070 / NCIMB 11131 / UNIQEM 75 / OB3b) TaxID=595536 RepID=A0A2D2CYU3_METT3|nr:MULTISPECIES: HAMP domain-containing sensor histidine kinase [Methylosinus]ATQ67896.1 sensor histidine kinase [Methylosinus trichosporium OB3b]OBS51275.1 hypothetical protein A8B73_17160 [Methylosinus sp. 3S-1]
MIFKRSLLSRLILFSLFGGVIVMTTMPFTYIMPMTYFELWPFANRSINRYASERARAVVFDSLRRHSDGELFIEDTPALRALKVQTPRFRFAVIDEATDTYVDGSSPELAELLDVETFKKRLRHIEIPDTVFRMKEDGDLRFLAGFERFGTVKLVTYGEQFSVVDLLYEVRSLFGIGGYWKYSPVLLGVVAISAVTLRRGLGPLRKVAATVAAIDLNSLNKRVPTADVPSEILPLVDALNQMLARVDSGVASQKRFAANSAHELRTPLTILRGRVDRMTNSTTKFELKRDIQRLQTLVEQLLVIARDEGRGPMLQAEVVDLEEVACAVVADYLPISLDLGRGIEFETDVSDAVHIAASDWAVQCVIRNLVENAVRAEPEGGTVVVRVLSPGMVEVVDHGSGVDAEDRDAIFDPFWRKTDHTLGSGLGLAITRELIGRYGGKIWVEDTPGGGATFKIALCPAEASAIADQDGSRPLGSLSSEASLPT